VDESCIYCELCVETAPENFAFDENEGYAYVSKQPITKEEIRLVLEALKDCPIESIGDRENLNPNYITPFPKPTIWQKILESMLGR
jgi:ferredoxin